MNILINYADSKYEAVRKVNTLSAKFFRVFDSIYQFTPDSIDENYRQLHKDIFSYTRGNGLWLWKPYLINKVIRGCKDGDKIFYCDSGSFFVRSPKYILDLVSDTNPFFVCDIPLIESNWTKPECFNILLCESDCYRFSNQIIATYFVVYVNNESRNFVQNWLSKCENIELLSPSGLEKGQFLTVNVGKNFVSHREDQSIFSLLCKMNNIVPHRDISQRGFDVYSYYNSFCEFSVPVHQGDNYPSILFLHKARSFFSVPFFHWIKRFVMVNIFRIKSR